MLGKFLHAPLDQFGLLEDNVIQIALLTYFGWDGMWVTYLSMQGLPIRPTRKSTASLLLETPPSSIIDLTMA